VVRDRKRDQTGAKQKVLMNHSVVIFGASGFIGTRLVSRLAGAGKPVVAVDIASPRHVVDGVSYITGDVRERLSPNLSGPGCVIYNLAAVHRTPGHPPHEYYETNVLGAQNVTRFAQESGAHALVFTSSISVYGPSEEPVTESSLLTPASDYGRSKMMAEEIHRRWRETSPGRKLVVVRPGVVFGPGERGNYSHLARALKRRAFAYPGRKSTIKSGGYVDELLRSLDFALGSADDEVTFNFAFPEESTAEDIVIAFGRVAGYRTSYPVLPISLMLAAAGVFEGAAALGLKTPIHRERIWKLVRSTRVRPQWLLDNGYVFSSDLESALKAWAEETDGTFV